MFDYHKHPHIFKNYVKKETYILLLYLKNKYKIIIKFNQRDCRSLHTLKHEINIKQCTDQGENWCSQGLSWQAQNLQVCI